LNANHFSDFQERFHYLRGGIAEIKATATAMDRAVARRFNLFHLLGVSTAEVRTHSALLAELLNPHGSHAQGTLFLEQFCAMCAGLDPAFPLLPPGADRYSWVVEKEKVTPLGNLDIVVSCPSLRYRFAIENKIYAVEQPNQLQRYAEWLSWDKPFYDAQALIFLTPQGWPARSAEDVSYFQLSYREDICAWLQGTLADVAAPRVCHVLSQYIEIIEHL
jgi:hypothetical protein